MKHVLRFSLLILCSLLFYSNAFAQASACPSVTIAPVAPICPGNCTNLTATVQGSVATTSYSVSTIPYSPYSYTTGTPVLVNIDDIWTPVISIPFCFQFFGNTYSQMVIGSNGLISFNTAYANLNCQWPIGAAIPSASDPINSIMAPWHDIDPSIGSSSDIRYQVYGSAPCREFVISWYNIPMFSSSCNSQLASQQIVLHETTNIIDIYITNKPLCASWNGGYAIEGIQNAAGTAAVFVAGRNYPTQWTAANDGKRFMPTGATQYTLNWTGPSGNLGNANPITVCPTTTSTYTCTVTNSTCAGNVVVSATQTVTVTAPFTLTPAHTNVNCNGACNGTASVTPSVGGSYTYVWTPNVSSTSSASGLCAGTYTIAATNTTGCTITQTITITEPPPITATQSQVNVNCNGGCTGSATVVASGGTGVFTYLWNPNPQTTATAINLCAGSYTCTISSPAGCTLTQTFNITQPSALTATSTVGTIACNGGTTTATVTASGGTAPYTYAWTPSGGSSATSNPLGAGNYTCTITDAHGCTTTQSFAITQPSALTATQSQGSITCNGGTTTASVVVSGGSPSYTYVWTPSGGNAATSTALGAGSYTCTVTDSHGCVVVKAFSITQPPPITATQSQVNVNCNGGCTGSATVVASGGTGVFTYSWSPNPQTTATAINLCAGTYTCVISSPAGCTLTQTFNITQPSALTATSTVGTIACNGGTTTATVTASGGTAPYTYAWTPSGGSSATSNPLGAGNYTCTVTDAHGCTTTQSFAITQPPVLTATQSQGSITCNGGTTTASVVVSGGSPSYTYVWTPSGGNAATSTALGAGSYTCTVTDSHGCVVVKAFSITQPPPITATQSQVNVNCNGGCTGSATVVASGGTGVFTYSWSPNPQTTATAINLCAGTYTCVISSPAGCTLTQTFNITQPSALTATSTVGTIACNGGTTTATVTASGGTAPYTYAWTPSGGSSATSNPLGAGNYTCTVTDAHGCTTTQSFAITQPAALTATQSQGTIACNGGTTTASVVVSGGTAPYTYAWTPTGGSAATSTAIGAGTYTCTITDSHGCVITKTFTITQPPVLTASTTTVPATCGNPNGTATVTAAGGTGPYTYSWSPAGGTGATTTGVLAGTYTVTVTDSHGCTVTATAAISNTGGPTATISASTNVSCFGGNNGSATVTVTGGTGPYTYAWTPTGGTGATGTPLTANSYTVTVHDANGCVATATVTITQPPVLTASATSTPVLCNGGNTGTATVTASGGTAPYTYAWTPTGGTGTTASNLTATTYTCTVTDSHGCTTTATTTVTQPTAVTATQSQVNELCNGGSTGSATVVASGGTGPYTYNWAPTGGTGSTASGLPAGTYTCTITDANGCVITKTFTLTQPTPVTATTATTTATCGNPNGSATVTPSGGTGPYTYLWAPSGGTGATASGLTAGTYTCTITDANGCSITASVTIINAGSPTATISASTNISCFGGNNGSATVTASGGTGPYTYAWAPSGGTGSTASTLIAGTYTVTVTDANGCTATATVTLTQPPVLTASATSTPVLCNGGNTGSATVTASGGTSPYTYAWAPSGGTGTTAPNLTAGTYTCTVTDANGCTTTATTTVTQPTAVTASATSTPVLCNGGNTGSATVTATGGTPGYTYLWAPSGGTGATENGLVAGTYTCTVTDANGCVTTATTTVTQPTAVSLSTSFVQSTCGNANGSASVVATGGTPGYTYLWAPSGGTGATEINLLAGVYTVTVTDANGCVSTATVNVPNAGSPSSSITASTNVSCFGGNNGSATVTATGGASPYTYAWSPIGGTGATGTSLIAGTYTCTVTDANGCTTTSTVTITEPPLLTASATSTPVLCNSGNTGSATVTAAGGVGPYTYSWAPSGGTGTTAPNLTAGTYTCTVTDANGCTTTATTTVTEPPALTASATSTPVLCNGGNTGSATVTATGGTPGYTYLWAPSGGTGATENGLVAGTYTCTVTDANGCTTTATTTVTQPTAVSLSTSFVQSTCGNANGSASVVATGGTPGYTYLWAPSGGTGATEINLLAGVYTVTVTDANGCVSTATVNVPNAGSPTATITAHTNVLCFGGNNGDATVSATGGTLPYTYAWSPIGGTGAVGTSLTAGTYTVTVTDANGCSSIDSVTITEPPLLTATATSTPVLCNGGNTGSAIVVPAGGVGPYTYLWAPSGGTGATEPNLIAGTYTCTVTDANGCTATASTTVTQPTQLTTTFSQFDVICNAGNTGSATVTPAGGTPGYTYLWAPSGGTGSTASNLIAGTYTCTITDTNGCFITQSFTITQPPPITLVTSFVQSTCGNANGSVSVVASGGTPGYGYSWAPFGGTNATENNLLAGSYTVTVTDSKGCTAVDSVTVINAGSPTATITAHTDVLCFGGNNGDATVTTTGGTLPYTYAWSPIGGTGSVGTSLTAGTYTVTVTDANGCTSIDSVTITEPPVLTATTTSWPVLCNGGSTGSATVLPVGGNPNPAYTYAWAPSGGTGATENNLVAGTYTCTVTDANGCTTTASTTVTQPTQLTTTFSQVDELCNGGNNASATVAPAGGTAPYIFAWTPTGGTGATESNLLAGTYTCTITDTNGCFITQTFTITEPNAIVVTPTEVDAHCNQSDGSASATAVGGTGAYTYNWMPGNVNAQNLTNVPSGVYTVTVTDANGCTGSASITINNLNGVNASLASSTNIACFGQATGAINITQTGGNGPYTYAWLPNISASSSATGVPSGNYQVTVTDANGCTSVVTVTLTQPPLLTIAATSTPTAVCNGTPVTINSTPAGGTPGLNVVWTPGNLSGNSQTVVPNATTSYTATVTDANGCTATDTTNVVVNPVPVAAVSGDVLAGCAPVCVNFSDISTIATPGIITSWSWDFGDNSALSTSQNPTHCYNTPGVYSVILNIVSGDGCTSTITMPNYINVYANPVAAFGATPQPATMIDPLITFTDSSTGATSWNWSFGDIMNSTSTLQNPTFTYNDPTCYEVVLTVSTVNGCTDTATKEICIGPEATIYVPNAFTPNDDGKNDVFLPVGLGLDPDNFEMWIFDRWGNMIYYTDDLNKGWDGRVQGGEEVCQIDTYVWKIKAKDITGKTNNLLGKVSLIK